MTGDSIGSEMSLTVPLPAVENVSLVPQLQSVSFIPKKSFFLSAGRAERTLSRALRSFGAVFEEGLLHHCRAAHDSTTRALLQFRCWTTFSILDFKVQQILWLAQRPRLNKDFVCWKSYNLFLNRIFFLPFLPSNAWKTMPFLFTIFQLEAEWE